jgi:hypothetical protein
MMVRAFYVKVSVILALVAMNPLAAQGVRTVDPNAGFSEPALKPATAAKPPAEDINADLATDDAPQSVNPETATAPTAAQSSATTPASTTTYKQDDLIGAAEGVFGKGAAGLAGIIEKILKDQGEPNAYISGREASGAFVVGLRYGSGTLKHSVEGERPVYWTGPSIGFDVGGDAAKVFVLVYNLYDSQDLYKRYPQGEGRAYFVGGFSAGYLRRGDVVLIPVRLGVGVRLGANVGYMKFRDKAKWLPF